MGFYPKGKTLMESDEIRRSILELYLRACPPKILKEFERMGPALLANIEDMLGVHSVHKTVDDARNSARNTPQNSQATPSNPSKTDDNSDGVKD